MKADLLSRWWICRVHAVPMVKFTLIGDLSTVRSFVRIIVKFGDHCITAQGAAWFAAIRDPSAFLVYL